MTIVREIKARFKELLTGYFEGELTVEEERELLNMPLIHPALEKQFADEINRLRDEARKLQFLNLSWKMEDGTASRLENAEYRTLLQNHPELEEFYRDICMMMAALKEAVRAESEPTATEPEDRYQDPNPHIPPTPPDPFSDPLSKSVDSETEWYFLGRLGHQNKMVLWKRFTSQVHNDLLDPLLVPRQSRSHGFACLNWHLKFSGKWRRLVWKRLKFKAMLWV